MCRLPVPTGELKWTFPLSYPDDVGFSVAPTLGPDGTLYFATNYKIYALGTAP